MENFYALELYSVRDELQKDMWGTLRKVKKMGYDAVEFFGHYNWTAQEVKAALEDTGLICCSWHTPWEYVQPSSIISTISYNKVIGNTDIVVPGLPTERTCCKEAWLETAKLFNDISCKLADYGMHLGYHNHSAEFIDMEGDTPWHYLFDNTDDVGMQLDNGNALSAGRHVDIYSEIVRYPGKAKTVHLKPYSFEKGYDTMIGEDDIDWGKFIGLCNEHHDIMWFIVEYESEKLHSQLDGVKHCINALYKMEDEGII